MAFARHLDVPREDRLQAGGAHFDRLLCHVVEAGVFEGGKPVVQIERAALGPGAGTDGQRKAAFSRTREHPLPFAVTTVENQHRIAGFQPQHVAEIVCLRGVERDGRPVVERHPQVEARRAEIVTGHEGSRDRRPSSAMKVKNQKEYGR